MIFILWDYECDARMRILLTGAKFGYMPPNHHLHTDGGGFPLAQVFCRFRRVITSPEFGSDFAPPPVKRSDLPNC